ncbi:MAG: phosphate transporter substrate-binding protein [Gemmatimonadetes bacterium]|nr:phosphate transporter substrate-binding protein [Gemmatimonadota bacterium]
MHHIPSRPRYLCCLAAALALAACGRKDQSAPATRLDLTGAGATFPYPLYRAWFSEYATRTNVRINYFSVGSAEGVRLLAQGEVDFGATDKPLAREPGDSGACARVAVPTVLGPIAIVYHLPAGASLRFDARLLADIFSGRIRRWDAPAVRVLNAGVVLPAMPIVVVHRASGSGTGRAFSDYLAKTGKWRTPADSAADVVWPVGVAVEGNEGVASEVKVTVGAIGYVELVYARQNRLAVAAVQTAAGDFVPPGQGSGTYPIVAQTWLVLDPAHVHAGRGSALVTFIRWALEDGATSAKAMEYFPAPPDTVARYDSLLRKIDFAACGGR